MKMNKRTWLVVLFLAAVLVITLGTTSVFAHDSAASDSGEWEEMHEACENGDYEAMAEMHAQYHDGDVSFDDMMGSGRMGGGWAGGMMGGW